MKQKFQIENDKGSVTVLAVVLLMLLTLLGMAALSTSSIETQIAGNEMRSKLAFYAAESAKAYVVWKPDLYGPDNITVGTSHYFPNNIVPYVAITAGLPTAQSINATQSFNGKVEYTSSSSPPRGSGYSASTFRAHQYKMICNGYSTNNTVKDIEVGFYRIGF
jgi:PilX N-terminal